MTTTMPAAGADQGSVPEFGRVQLALNVTDVDEAVEFYRRLFATEPAKRRPGYANFAIESPPLKLVLIESADGGTINHLGVEVATTDQVTAAEARIKDEGLATTPEMQTECCYALQDKVWIDAPDGEKWEVYTVLGDSQQGASSASASDATATTACC